MKAQFNLFLDRMLDLCQIRDLARDNSAQELLSALLWQCKFAQFNGEKIVGDLNKYSNLWASFLFVRPAYAPDRTGLSLKNTVQMLVELANSNIYQADTLYVLAKKQDSIVSRLLDLGQKWQADSIEIFDGENCQSDARKLQQQLAKRLKRSLRQSTNSEKADGVVICFWWDRSNLPQDEQTNNSAIANDKQI